MAAQIIKAISSGYSPRSVLRFLAHQSPKYSKQINQALNYGFSASTILRYLTSSKDKTYPEEAFLTPSEQSYRNVQRQRTEPLKTLGKAALTAGALGLGAAGLIGRGAAGAAAGAAAQGTGAAAGAQGTAGAAPILGSAGPQIIGKLAEGATQRGASNAKPFTIQNLQKQAAELEKNAEEASPESVTEIEDVTDFPHLRKKTIELIEKGKAPQEIYETLSSARLYKPLVESFEKHKGKSFLDEIKTIFEEEPTKESLPQSDEQPIKEIEMEKSGPVSDVLKKYQGGSLYPTETINQPLSPEKKAEIEKLIPSFESKVKHHEQELERFKGKGFESTAREDLERSQAALEYWKGKLASKPVVLTPEGAGTLKNIHKDNAYVEENGKLRKVPLSDINEPSENAIEAVTTYLNIPEKDRSSNVALFAWNPEERRAYFQFHNEDSFYEYLDVPEEIVDAIAEKRAIPKTSGGNDYGVWSPEDTESIGAALWKYIVNSPKYKKAKKGEPENPFYRKLPIKYDYWKALRKKRKR